MQDKVKRRSRILGGLFFGLIFFGVAGAAAYTIDRMPEKPRLVRLGVGAIKHEAKVDAVFANREYLLQAPASGKAGFVGPEGQRFRRGEVVASVAPEGAAPGAQNSGTVRTVQAPQGGLLYQEVDGLESLFTPDNLLDMDLPKLLALPGNKKTLVNVQAGEVFGKIVDNLSPSASFLELPSLEGLTRGQNLSLRVGGKAEVGKIMRKSDNPMGVVVQYTHFVEGSVENRRQKIDWIIRPAVNGVLVPKSALWREGTKQGIYLVLEGVIHFREVQILDENNDFVCVKDLTEGVLAVANPRQGLEETSVTKK
ncbi:MAG: HlyD family efflux transporter periplasmic adaptor subunit [Desulfitobacteriaceae bacterium]